MQRLAVIQLSLSISRKYFRDFGCALESGNNTATQLGRAKSPHRNDQHSPAKSMPDPTRPGAWRRKGGRPGRINAEHRASLRFPNFPDEAVVVKMEKR